MEKNVAIIGVGNCGSQVAYLAEKKYKALFDSIYINTSKDDLSMVAPDSKMKFKIGEDDEVEGSGKDRDAMKEYLESDINKVLGNESLQQCIVEKKYCFIIVSTAGGTGSGGGPVLYKLMSLMFPDTHFIIVGVLPKLDSSLGEHGNSIEFLNELYEVIGGNVTYMIYDNESTAHMSSTAALEAVNENIIEDIRVLTGVDNFPTPYESIDAADMESIITTPGRLLVVRLNKGLTEKAFEDNNIDDMIIKGIKQSCHAETDRNKKVIRWGIITHFTKEVNNLFTSSLDGLVEFLGTPVERFNHNSINDKDESLNFMYVIASGLSPINDRVKRITNKIEDLKSKLSQSEGSEYILSGEGVSISDLITRRAQEKRNKQAPEINPSDIFNQFKK